MSDLSISVELESAPAIYDLARRNATTSHCQSKKRRSFSKASKPWDILSMLLVSYCNELSNPTTNFSIAHAALCIMTNRENPDMKNMPADPAYVFYGLVNSRERLRPPFNGRDAFTGWGLALTCLSIPVSLVSLSAAAGNVGQLKILSEAMKAEYVKQKDLPSLLAVEGRMIDTILRTPATGPLVYFLFDFTSLIRFFWQATTVVDSLFFWRWKRRGIYGS